MKKTINTEDTFYTKESDIPATIKYGDFYYYKCSECNQIKSKRFYTKAKVDFVCRECKFVKTYKGTDKSDVQKRRLQTLKDRYGTVSTSQFIDYSKIDYKERQKKINNTVQEKYNVKNVSQLQSSQDKRKQTTLAKYGVEHSSQASSVKAKTRNTILHKYGSYSNAPGPKASHQKFLDQRSNEIDTLDLDWLDKDKFRGKWDNGTIYYHFKCHKCGTVFEDDFHNGLPICRTCNPMSVNTSKEEKDIVAFIKTFYNGTILENDRTVLKGKELDIYLPDINFAIEYNGTYWHGYRKDTEESISEFTKKLQEKRLLCKDLGIRLVTIDEADYMERPDVFNRFLQDCIAPRTRVFARNCELREIDTKTAREFCEYYHVNGYRGGYIKYGLYYNNDLLCVAIFGKHKVYGNECIRLVYKTGYSIIGGWEKIIKHFGKQFLHYVNLKYFSGDNKTGCGYRFWIRKRLVSRQQLQRSNIHNYCNDIKEGLSDFQNCLLNNGIAIFDLGNDIRIYNKEL